MAREKGGGLGIHYRSAVGLSFLASLEVTFATRRNQSDGVLALTSIWESVNPPNAGARDGDKIVEIMETILKEINLVLGVSGSFICDAEGKLLAQALPNITDPAPVAMAARVVAQVLQALESAGQRASEIDLTFADRRLILKTVRGGALAILCARSINLPLLNLTANLAAKKLAQELKKPKPPQPALPATRSAAAPQPVLSIISPPLLVELEQAAHYLIAEARRRQIDLYLMDSLAIWLNSGQARQWLGPLTKRELVFAGRSAQQPAIESLLQQQGYAANAAFNASFQNRLKYSGAERNLAIDAYLDTFSMYHRVDLLKYLSGEGTTLPVTALFLMRAQTVEMTPEGVRDLCALVLEHDVAVGAKADQLDATAITQICVNDWGWFKTVSLNLDRLNEFSATVLPPAHFNTIRERVQRLQQSIASAPKSLRWQTRAAIGESARWYETPVTGQPRTRPDMAIG